MITYRVSKYQDFFDSLLTIVEQNNLLSDNIDEIILTDEYERIVNLFSNQEHKGVTREREYSAVGSIVIHNQKKKLIFNANYVHGSSEFTPYIFCSLLIQVYAGDIVEQKLQSSEFFTHQTPLPEVIISFFLHWATEVLMGTLRNEFFAGKIRLNDNVKIYVDSYKKKVRKFHYKYQEDQRIDLFWTNNLQAIDEFVRRCINVFSESGDFSDLQEFEDVIPPLIKEIESQTKNLLEDKKMDIDQIQEYVLIILKNCYIEVSGKDQLKINVAENPKKIWKANLVDTEPRLVAFIDILGFSAIVKEYDTNIYSNILNELHDTLENSITISIDNLVGPNSKTDLREFLEYRMFSDCLCISLPFIEYGNDFHIQFHSLASIVRTYQLSMMLKGFYVRGGLSMGSFYADRNMIFSGGLITAYKLEQTAENPIIVIDDAVLKRLRQNFPINAKGLFFERTMLYSLADPTKVFFNPFDSLDNSGKYLDTISASMNNILNNEMDESDDISQLTSSFLKITAGLLQPIFDSAKESLGLEKMIEIKEKILTQVNEQIFEFEQKPFDKHVGRVLNKYRFLQAFIEWSVGTQEQGQFKFYEFQTIEENSDASGSL